MIIYHINICPDLSTGNVMMGIADQIRQNGEECYTASPPKNQKYYENHYVIGSKLSRKLHIIIGRLLGNQGVLSIFPTVSLINDIKRKKPDIIHLHNIHSYYLNYRMFFGFLKKSNVKVVWTFHDCWPMTGHCTHFQITKCEKWKNGCYKCPNHKQYPKSVFDNTKKMWKMKKRWFTSLSYLTIVTPSKWLAGIVEKSFFSQNDIRVINNGISLSVFKPTENKFRSLYKLEKKFIVLGVASDWSYNKGLDVFIELAQRLDEKFAIVMVGLRADQLGELPENIIAIEKTSNQSELADIYSSADLFINPTREDNYPTVNMEAIACGTPVLTFDTGGSKEIINESTGKVTEQNNVESMIKEILDIQADYRFTKEACVNHAANFEKSDRYLDYYKLYTDILH